MLQLIRQLRCDGVAWDEHPDGTTSPPTVCNAPAQVWRYTDTVSNPEHPQEVEGEMCERHYRASYCWSDCGAHAGGWTFDIAIPAGTDRTCLLRKYNRW
jgi:hypothetical protein